MGIQCEYEFCIYQQDWQCLLDRISLDCWGVCDSCVVVAIPPEELARYKRLLLERLEGNGKV